MRKCDLINSSHVKVAYISKRMKILDESSKPILNFINSLHYDLIDLVVTNS